MSFLLQGRPQTSTPVKVDIVGIPAVGADPTKSFVCNDEPWFPSLYEWVPSARIFLYDHLAEEERDVEKKPHNHTQHKASIVKHAEVEEELAQNGIEEWAERFAERLKQVRESKAEQQRPIIFIAHSTGGIILKQVLCRKLDEGETDLLSVCIGVIFFSTPHKGSSVLSKDEFSKAIQKKLDLKFEMSELLRSQLSHENSKLELLSHSFGSRALGIPIWNYLETLESPLKVLTDSEMLTNIKRRVVDIQSAEMRKGPMSSLIEAEEFMLNTSHVGTARLADDGTLCYDFKRHLKQLVHDTNQFDRKMHHDLITQIKNDLKVDVHQFYHVDEPEDQMPSMVWSETASLHDFLESGPASILQRRLKRTESLHPQGNGQVHGLPKPSIHVRQATEPQVPKAIKRAPPIASKAVEREKESDKTRQGKLKAPLISIPGSKHTRRPSPTRSRSAERNLPPQDSQMLKSSSLVVSNALSSEPTTNLQAPSEPAPKRVHTFQTPSKTRDKFQWIHVPACLPGLVPKIMTAIEKDKGHMDLQKKLLMDQNWSIHHNRSRHASSHARFVRSFFKLLMPRGSSHHDEILSPASAFGDPQLALYMPYLHWDLFTQLKLRTEVLKRRRDNKSARPVDRKILNGQSLEHKLIWQFLAPASSSIHVRRTLDQYGYPSLRDIEARDNDQVLYKKTRPAKVSGGPVNASHGREKLQRSKSRHHRKQVKTIENGTACVLMVDQLWCWVLSEDTILTFFPPKEKGDDDNGSHIQADVLTNIRKDIDGDYAVQVEDCYDFVALVMSHCVKSLLENEDPSLQVFRIFEEYISELTEDQVKSFKLFRDSHRVEELSVRKGNPLPQFLDNSKDLNNLLELRDIEDELKTLKKLLNEQQKIVDDMIEDFKELNQSVGKGNMGTSILLELKEKLEDYEDQVKDMLESSDVAQDSYQQLLDMKQKHSNIIEAHLAREQTETAAEQSRSVMIFTVVTIIFLPLSFLSSLFGMNVWEWSGTDTNPHMWYVMSIMFGVTLTVFLAAIFSAFNHFTRRILVRVSRLVLKVFARPASKLLGRRNSTNLSKIASWDVEKGPINLSFPGTKWMATGWRKKEAKDTAKVKKMDVFEELKGLDGELWSKEE